MTLGRIDSAPSRSHTSSKSTRAEKKNQKLGIKESFRNLLLGDNYKLFYYIDSTKEGRPWKCNHLILGGAALESGKVGDLWAARVPRDTTQSR